MEAMTQRWSDDRLDDLNRKVDDLGRRVDSHFARTEVDRCAKKWVGCGPNSAPCNTR